MRLIDVDKLKKSIPKTEVDIFENCRYCTLVSDEQVLEMINKQPIVKEQKKGKWIGKPIAGYSTVRCSCCEEIFLENEGKWNYCPNCGAKMEEEDDEIN